MDEIIEITNRSRIDSIPFEMLECSIDDKQLRNLDAYLAWWRVAVMTIFFSHLIISKSAKG